MRTVVDAIVANRGGPGTLTAPGEHGAASTVTWPELHAHAKRMAAVLAREGVGRGSRVGLLADTGIDLVTALQAVWLTGAAVTVLPMPARADTDAVARLSAIIADAALHVILVGDPMLPLLPALGTVTKAGTLDGLRASAATADPADPVSPDPDDLAVLQYTSGSTRSPRGVPVRHRHLAANLLAIRAAVDHDAHHPYTSLSWLPLYHDMGLIGFCALPMSCGCPLVLQSPRTFVRRPASWLEALARDRIPVTGAPNFACALARRLLAAGLEVDLTALRLLVSGGEPVDAAMMADLASVGQRRCGLDPAALLPAYGLAESTLAVTFSRPGAGVRTDAVDRLTLEAEGRAVPGSHELVRVGTPVRGSHVRITHRTTGAPLGERRVGHVEVAGPSVIGHYWGEPPPTGPWLRTGDLGYLAEGELVVCGREKDVLFAAGRNIYPQDVEAAAFGVAEVRAGAAFGVPRGTADRLVVAVESSPSVDAAELRRAVTAAVLDEVGLAPAAVLVLPPGRLPKTTSGKLRRSEVRARYLSGELDQNQEGTWDEYESK